jgi:hypothetical protein
VIWDLLPVIAVAGACLTIGLALPALLTKPAPKKRRR